MANRADVSLGERPLVALEEPGEINDSRRNRIEDALKIATIYRMREMLRAAIKLEV